MAEKQEEFQVVDKRRVNAEAETPAEEPEPVEEPAAREAATEAPPTGEAPASQKETAEAPPTGEAPVEEPEEAAGEGQIPAEVDIYVLLSSMIGMLHGFAWQKMGFVANRETGQVEEDLPQAKIAVDTVQFLAQKLEAKLSEAETREVRRLVMDLQMNYLRKSGSGS